MQTYHPGLEAQFRQMLATREAELRARLVSPVDEGLGVDHEVQDFKDVADEQVRASLHDMQAEQAERELAQLVAARHRMSAGHFGECLACGEPIDLRRLLALPATPLCAACQARHEHSGSATKSAPA